MDLHVGTSGYSYPKWKGSLYPKKLPAKQMLSHYSKHFQTVEINYTFKHMPTTAMLEAWASAVPAGFQFGLKAPAQITHRKQLKDSDDLVANFLAMAGTLKERLGPLLFQLPPSLTKDVPRLRAFLALLPLERRVALEFRHPSWFDDEVFGWLRDQGVTLCLADDPLEVPVVATTDWGYVRLRRPAYDEPALREWLQRLQDQDWRDVFVFFKHEDTGKGPRLARRLLAMAALTGHTVSAGSLTDDFLYPLFRELF